MTAMARLTALLFAMWLGVTVSTVVDLEKRIVGGHDCGPKERLYHVHLKISDGKDVSSCGGSLISDQWILTAAHCVEPGRVFTAYIGVHPGPATEVLITDPPVRFSNSHIPNDLMLLKLPQAVGIIPVPLPDCNDRPNIGDTVQIAGHAATTAGPNKEKVRGSSATLQCADIDVTDCQGPRNDDRWICASRPSVDICDGDSGGGVVYKDRIHAVHVMSNPLVCVSPATFMNLCHQLYLNWIIATINPNAASG